MMAAMDHPAKTDLACIRLVLIDDHAMVRDSLASRLENETDLNVVGVAGVAGAGKEEVFRLRPDVVLMDIDMPGMSCFHAARQIHREWPEIRIVFLSAFTNDSYIEQALAVKARGYLTKKDGTGMIVDAVRTVAMGGVHFSQEVRSRLIVDGEQVRLGVEGQTTRGSMLTVRELEVLRYIAGGMAKKEIGNTMDLSVKTIESHSNSIMQKLNIHDRVELALYAIREGLAEA